MAEGNKSFLETVGGLVTIVGAVAALTAYCVSLQFSLNQASREIERLDKQLASITAQTGSTARGPKGDKGDPGDQGPRGERGPQGEMGPAGVTEAQVRQLIQQLVQQPTGSLPVSGGVVQTSQAASSPTISSDCTDIAGISEDETLLLSKGQEFCEADGRLIATVHDIYTTGTLIISRPGVGLQRCDKNKKCALPWLSSASYIYERAGTDGNGRTALLRRSR